MVHITFCRPSYVKGPTICSCTEKQLSAIKGAIRKLKKKKMLVVQRFGLIDAVDNLAAHTFLVALSL
jgi:hypothetical protein